MNIYDEICKLPQYYYEWKSDCGIWGSQYYNKNKDRIGDKSIIMSIWKQLKTYYEQDGEQENLSDNEKIEYGKAIDRMRIYCEKKPLSDDDFNMNELKGIINKLSIEDIKEIEWQIDMYKRGQYYYSRYVHDKL